MKIEFDPLKANENPDKHGGVTFEEAAPALLDPFALTHEDMGGKRRLLLVVWTLRGDAIRIISAWKGATRNEVRN